MRFSLRQLMVMVTLISVGLGSLIGAMTIARLEPPAHPFVHVGALVAMIALWVGSGGMFGAAIGMLVGRIGAGITLGAAVQILIGLVLAMPTIH